MGYFESFDSISDEVESPFVGVVTVEQSVVHLVDKLKHVENLSDYDIIQIICSQFNLLLDYDFFFANVENRAIAQKVFTNERFLLKFLSVASTLHLGHHQIICCNKIAYDYTKLHGVENRIGELLLQLSAMVNRQMVLQLSGIIGEASAKYLAMVRNSSFVEVKNVKRVTNFLIYTLTGYKAKDLLNIYIRLFSRMTTLFVETMNYIPPISTPEEEKNNQTISIAMISILMNMSSVEMRKMLVSYGSDYILNRKNGMVRFSLQGLNGEYQRITDIVENIEAIEEIRIP